MVFPMSKHLTLAALLGALALLSLQAFTPKPSLLSDLPPTSAVTYR
jgi:hypothetical protein